MGTILRIVEFFLRLLNFKAEEKKQKKVDKKEKVNEIKEAIKSGKRGRILRSGK